MAYPKVEYRITNRNNGKRRYALDREVWWINAQGEKDWRIDALGTFHSREAAEAAIAMYEQMHQV